MKKKFPVKRVVLIVVTVGLVGTIAFNMLKPKGDTTAYQRAIPLTVMDLKSTVDVTGTVASQDSTTVHSALGEPVTEIAVKVGDRVEEGQLLGKLDTAAIESDIIAQQSAIALGGQTNQLRVKQAQTDLYYAEWYREHNQDQGILAAEQAVKDAERAVDSAKYRIRSAEDDYDIARDEVDVDDSDVYKDTRLNQLRDTIANAYKDLEGTKEALAAAKQRLNRAKWDSDAKVKELQDAVASAENAADMTAQQIALQKLKDNLDDCIINAPISGTVTAVYAKEGAEAKGLLFVIEDTEALVIETTIKEFDINSVKPGMPVQIKSDATGSEVFEGEVLSIDPASLKDAAGETKTGSTAEYAAKVKVVTPNSGLKIGMNARVNIILEQRDQKMAVLFDSVTTDAEGNSIVYVARAQDDGTYIAQAVTVVTGMETDLYLEVSGDLAEGDLILQDPTGLTDGMPVNLMPDMTMGSMGGGGAAGAGGGTTTVVVG